jgi:hypothetical protein
MGSWAGSETYMLRITVVLVLKPLVYYDGEY